MSIDDALQMYLVQLDADGRSIHTRKQYQRHVRLLATWLRTQGHCCAIEDIDHQTLARFLTSPQARNRPDGRAKKATATNALRSSLRTFFSYLHAAGDIPTNPARLIRRARCQSAPPRALSQDEQARLLRAASAAEGPIARRDEMLIRVLLATGVRIGSALGLDVPDIDFENGEILLRGAKGDRDERTLLGREIRDRLAQFVSDRKEGPVFMSQSGRRISCRHVQRQFARILRIAGIRASASCHSLRHTFAMDLYQRSGDIFLVKEALGHRSIASTVMYARVPRSHLRSVL